MPKEGLGYRPHVERDILAGPVQADLTQDIARIDALIRNLNSNRPVAAPADTIYTWDQLVALTKQEEVPGPVLDKMIDTVYEIGSDLEGRAILAGNYIAAITDPIPVDPIFTKDTKEAAILLFGAPSTEITPAQMECIMAIMSGNAGQTEPQERATAGQGNGETDRVKFTTFEGMDDTIEKVKVEAPHFGMEFFVALAFILTETITKMILQPLCPLKILFVPIGKIMVALVTYPLYYSTLSFVDVRDMCNDCAGFEGSDDDGEDQTDEEQTDAAKDKAAKAKKGGCKDGTETTYQEELAKQFDVLQGMFRGEYPGMGLKDTDSAPICEDPDFKNGTRKPNTMEIAAAAKYKRAVQEFALRDSGHNPSHENLGAYIDTQLARNQGFAIKATAGNVQDSIRVSGGSSPSSVSIQAKTSIEGKTPAATMLKPMFQKNILLMVNQMLQKAKATDKMIKSATSLAFLEPRMADLLCCFIRLLFAMAVKVARDDGQQLTKWTAESPTSAEGFAAFIKEMANRELGTNLQEEFNKTRDQLLNDPNSKRYINEVLKVIKILEAILSGMASTVSADLSFAMDIDPGMLLDAIMGTIGQTINISVDAIMSEVRTPVQKFLVGLADQPDAARALEECEIFKLSVGFLTCGIDAMHNSMLRMIATFQRDIDTRWLQIAMGAEAKYNKKVIKIIRDVINIILNDFYALFTICNIDRMYTKDELNEASKNIFHQLKIQNQAPFLDKLDAIYNGMITYDDSKKGLPGYDAFGGVLLGEAGEYTQDNFADSMFANSAFGFLNPMKNSTQPLLDSAISALTADDANKVLYNKEQSVKEKLVPAIIDKLAEASVVNCETCTTSTLLRVAFGNFDRTGTFGS